MYKVAYKSNIFGKVMIEKFKDEKSAIGGVKKLKNKYYILYADTDMILKLNSLSYINQLDGIFISTQ